MPIVTTPGQDYHQQADQSSVKNNPVVSNQNQPVVSTNAQTQNNSVSNTSSTVVDQSNSTQEVPNRVQSMVAHNRNKKKIAEDINSLDDDLFDNDDFDGLDDLTTSSSSSSNQKKDNKTTSLSRMSEEDRKSVINKVFSLVLGREPADRDYSYYRFSTLTEEGLMKSLLGLPEHKTILENATQYPSVKQELAELDIKFKQADELFHSMQNEVNTMRQLLEEKNRYIQGLRNSGNVERQQYAATPPQREMPGYSQPAQQVQPVENSPIARQETQQHQVPVSEGLNVQKLPSPMDEIKSMFKSIFSKNR